MIRKTISRILSIALADAMLMTSVLTASAAGLGDVNSDAVINAVDASEILSEYARVSTNQKAKLTDEQKKCADVDKNGNINAVDASQVLSYYAYKSTSGTMEFEDYLKNPPVTTTAAAAVTTTTTTTTASSSIVGKWLPDDEEDNEGIAFSEDGNVSLFFDASDSFVFRDDGLLYNDTLYPYEQIEMKDEWLTLKNEEKVLVEMKRLEKGDGYNGKYQLTGGEMYNGLLVVLLLMQMKDVSSVTCTAEFNGAKSELWLNNLFTYKVNGSTLEITMPVNAEASSENEAVEFSVDGNSLTIKSDDKETKLHRVG
ncbi:dockerin type I domain-containing protein [Ruminococcus flavefaciens]|uniref:dockerin type I domain-containing protein n=1 Tax=Ruminococcus flavefaciens TaxID=1265 RepID=UPI0026EDD923|nr:dockerin type I domain-containing protein [Ruminococcus flavefaciens]